MNTAAQPNTVQGATLQYIEDQGGTWKYQRGGRRIEWSVLSALEYKGLIRHETDGSWTLTADKVPVTIVTWVPRLTR